MSTSKESQVTKVGGAVSSRRQMQEQIQQSKLAREEARKQKKADEEKKMDIDPLADNETEKAYLEEQARLAGLAQASLTNTDMVSPGSLSAEEKGDLCALMEMEEVEVTGAQGVGAQGLVVAGDDNEENGSRLAVYTPTTSKNGEVIDERINVHLAELSMKDPTQGRLSTASPAKKKTKRPATPARSILRVPPHDHKYKRVILEGSVILTDDKPYQQFTSVLRKLMENALLVDQHFQIDPISEYSSRSSIRMCKDIPDNMTLLTEYIKINGNMSAFQKKRLFVPAGGGKKKTVEVEKDPVVWFCFAASFDPEAEYLVHRVSFEWGNIGGSRLHRKAVYSFDSITPVMCFKLYSMTEGSVLISEFQAILQETWDVVHGDLRERFGDTMVLSEMGVRLTAPWLPGVRLDQNALATRRIVHFEMDKNVVPLVKILLEKAKTLGIVQAKWGLKALVTESGGNLSNRTINNIKEALTNHSNFMLKMTEGELEGVDTLDKKEPFYSVTEPEKALGFISLRDLLLKYLKLKNGKRAIAEVHQGTRMGPVSVVFSNTSEAEMIFERMNKNVAAYLIQMLMEQGLPEELLKRIMEASCTPECWTTAQQCTWDEKNKTLLLPGEADGDEEDKEMRENTSWYAQEVGMHMVSKMKKTKKKKHLRAEDAYDLDTVGSLKTIHDSNIRRATRAARRAKDMSSDEEEEDDEEEEEEEEEDQDSDDYGKKPKAKRSGTREREEEDEGRYLKSHGRRLKGRTSKKQSKSKSLSGAVHHDKHTGHESDFEDEEEVASSNFTDSASKNSERVRPRTSIEFHEQVEIVGSSSDSGSDTTSAYSSEESEMEGDEADSG